MRFELDYLESYDDKALLAELRRVSALVKTPKLSISQFSAVAKVHGSTLQKRFGGWKNALRVAGLSKRVDGKNVALSREGILHAIKSTAQKIHKRELTLRDFEAHSGMTGGPVRRAFGSWSAALKAAGLNQSVLGQRYTDEQCFENMLALWTHYGRAPQHDEMNHPPSSVGAKAYVRRWGTWRKALAAFVQRVNSEKTLTESRLSVSNRQLARKEVTNNPQHGPRGVPLGLRYFILKRDSFRCVTCGSSPALRPGVVLHVDHIHPWTLGGATVASNLRTLCEACNLGKGARPK